MMAAALIEQVRSFNRTVTQTVGALQQDYLGRHRPLGESRLLFEIGRDGATAAALRARLGLDSGYLSRLLRSLERQGLLETRPLGSDGRVRRRGHKQRQFSDALLPHDVVKSRYGGFVELLEEWQMLFGGGRSACEPVV